ncbi:hypothetical protein PAMP_019040 [Pampus punctatissimus]
MSPSYQLTLSLNLTLHHNVCRSFHPQLIRYLFKGSCIYSTVDGDGAALVSAPTQFPENPKHTSSSTTAMAKCWGR